MNQYKIESTKRILITTAIKESWPSHENKVLFLGDWCKLYKDKRFYEIYESITADYHWDSNSKFNNDYKTINNIYEKLLIIISEKLNELHQVKFNNSSWRIIIGPWLGVFCQIVFDRWFMINHVYEKYNITNTFCLKYDLENQIPNDFNNFISTKMPYDIWNHILYSEIIKFKNYKNEELIPIEFKENSFIKLKVSKQIKIIKKIILKLIKIITQFGSQKDKYFFIHTCLSRFRCALLQLRLKQIPRIWYSTQIPKFDFEKNKRKWEINYIYDNEEEDLKEYIKILTKLIPSFMPKSYLEGFNFLNNNKLTSNWPISPKIIFTSGKQLSDDNFKIWAAKKIESGSKFFIGQHGGNYQTTKICFYEDHQKKISSAFIGWGARKSCDEKIKNVGLFISDFYKLKVKSNTKGELLLIENENPRYSQSMWSTFVSSNQWKKYFIFNSQLIKNLPLRIRKKSIIRIYPKSNKGNDYDSIKRWKNISKNISIDYCEKTFEEKLIKTRLAISTTNTTTMLHTLAINFPTIIYIQPEFLEIREDAQFYFDELKKVGILQTDFKSAVKHIENIWDNVNDWWYSKDTQKSRILFCNKFAKIQSNDLDLLIKIFKESNFL